MKLTPRNIIYVGFMGRELPMCIVNGALHVKLDDVLAHCGLAFKGNKPLEEAIQVFKGLSERVELEGWLAALFFPVEHLHSMFKAIAGSDLRLSDMQMRRIEVSAELMPRYLAEFILIKHETSSITYDDLDGSISAVDLRKVA